jgi:hypothetical protein
MAVISKTVLGFSQLAGVTRLQNCEICFVLKLALAMREILMIDYLRPG